MSAGDQQYIKELAEKIKQGDKNAFSQAYDNYSAALYGVILRILEDKEQANDVLQEAFVKIWKNAPKYDSSKGTFFTWMLNIARNTAIDKFRKNKRTPTKQIQNSDSGVSDMNAGSTSININHIGVEGIVNNLPDDLQLVIKYLYFKGYTQQELSDEMDIPLGTIKTRSRAAMNELRKLLKE